MTGRIPRAEKIGGGSATYSAWGPDLRRSFSHSLNPFSTAFRSMIVPHRDKFLGCPVGGAILFARGIALSM